MWSTIWSRVPLQSYTLSKSQRKLWRTASKRFRIEVGPYHRRDDQDIVYHRYQQAHPLDVGRSVDEVFGVHEPTHDFDTYTIGVYEQDRLVAFSAFDLGSRTLASLFGCYLPEYRKSSLGIFSMLAEMSFGRSLGLEHYHPGYCVPGLPAFAYKQRLPHLEGRTFLNSDWQPFGELLEQPLPHQIIEQRTQELQQALTRRGLKCTLLYMPLCEFVPIREGAYGAIPLPLAFELHVNFDIGECFVGYNPSDETFEIWFGSEVADLSNESDFDQLGSQVPLNSNLKFYDTRQLLFSSPDLAPVVAMCVPQVLMLRTLHMVPYWLLGKDFKIY